MPARWAAIVGREKTGRVRAVWSLVDALRGIGVSVGGVVQQRASGGDIDIVDIVTGRCRRLAGTSPDPDVCDWGFEADVFAEVRALLSDTHTEVLFVHAGRVEAQGRGHWATVCDVLERDVLVVLCMPPSSLARIALDLPDPIAALELPADESDVDWFVDELQRLARPANAA